MTLDRAATLRQAEKLLRQGKLDQAIDEYRRAVDEQPRDWTTANQLGDLLGRAGRVDQAIEQYTRIADALAAEGFLPKASALYKKILKLAPANEHALMQAGELAAAQGLLVDARTFFQAAVVHRRAQGDAEGTARVLGSLAAIDPQDIDARMAVARAWVDLGAPGRAIESLAEFASALVEQGREREAIRPLRTILEIDPTNGPATASLCRILLAQGDMEGAAAYLTPDAAARNPQLAVAAAELRIRTGDEAGGLGLLDRLLYGEEDHGTSMVGALAIALSTDRPEVAFRLVERVTDAYILRNDWDGAVRTLRGFADRVTNHVPVLTRLIDVCVDAGRTGDLLDAQVRLVDAYLANGAALEARYVAEDLVAQAPGEPAHIARFRRALEISGDPDPDRTIADRLAEPPALSLDAATLDGSTEPPLHAVESAPLEPAVSPAPAEQPGEAEHVEVDLSVALNAFLPAVMPTPRPRQPPPPTAATDIDDVFANLRDAASRTDAFGPGELSFQRGKALFDAGAFEASIDALRSAAREPARRFAAASLLARIFQHQRKNEEAIEWLGHAADAPVSEPGDRHRVLLQLADLLERSGESSRALGVCLELQADAGNYEDVAARVARLSRGHA